MGNGKRVTNEIFFTDTGHAQEPQGGEDMAQGAQEGDQQEVVADVHHEEEVEGAVGGQDVEDKDDEEEDEEDNEEDKGDNVIDELVTSGHIKMVSK